MGKKNEQIISFTFKDSKFIAESFLSELDIDLQIYEPYGYPGFYAAEIYSENGTEFIKDCCYIFDDIYGNGERLFKSPAQILIMVLSIITEQKEAQRNSVKQSVRI